MANVAPRYPFLIPGMTITGRGYPFLKSGMTITGRGHPFLISGMANVAPRYPEKKLFEANVAPRYPEKLLFGANVAPRFRDFRAGQEVGKMRKSFRKDKFSFKRRGNKLRKPELLTPIVVEILFYFFPSKKEKRLERIAGEIFIRNVTLPVPNSFNPHHNASICIFAHY